MSYATVYAESATCEGVAAAIRRRHACAGTDNIIIEFRLGEAFMGDEIRVGAEVPAIRPRILGTDTLRQVALVRNNEVVYIATPGSPDHDFEYSDQEPLDGESFYYLRAVQANAEIAWSSPIWVLRD